MRRPVQLTGNSNASACVSGEIMRKYERTAAKARGRRILPPRPSTSADPTPIPEQSERFDNNQNHDSDHQNSWDFVNDTVKLLRVDVAVLRKLPAPAHAQAVHSREQQHQQQLAMQPSRSEKASLESQPKAGHPARHHGGVDDGA